MYVRALCQYEAARARTCRYSFNSIFKARAHARALVRRVAYYLIRVALVEFFDDVLEDAVLHFCLGSAICDFYFELFCDLEVLYCGLRARTQCAR